MDERHGDRCLRSRAGHEGIRAGHEGLPLRTVAAMAVLLIGVVVLPVVASGTWKEAAPGYKFRFPADHAAHPDYKIEWWYYTGNLAAADGRRFGYQVTFFRVGVDPSPANPSAWAVRDLYMTHVAVSDLDGRRYRFDERLSRGGPGLAGARSDRFEVWNDDWTTSRGEDGRHALRIAGRDLGVALTLDEGKAPVVHGKDGISQKGAQAGNASHYYSLTRMPTRGTLTIDGEAVAVQGESWMDREFGTSFLEPGQQGWDWFAIQLEDGRELMIYQLRRADGSRDPRSSGTWVRQDGTSVALGAAEVVMRPVGPRFRSTASGADYPVAWRIEVPREGLALDVTTPLADQELNTPQSTGVSYWEGAVVVNGTVNGGPVRGRGYLEMTGYAGSMGRVLAGSPAKAPR
jgi:predicted secreted hydrolase